MESPCVPGEEGEPDERKVDPELADVMAAAVNSRSDQRKEKVLQPGREDGSRGRRRGGQRRRRRG